MIIIKKLKNKFSVRVIKECDTITIITDERYWSDTIRASNDFEYCELKKLQKILKNYPNVNIFLLPLFQLYDNLPKFNNPPRKIHDKIKFEIEKYEFENI